MAVTQFPFQKRYKERSIFFGMITVLFEPVETYATDIAGLELLDLVTKGRKRQPDDNERNMAYTYVSLLTATHDMVFHFTEDVPDEYRAVEVWWQMVQEKQPAATCFDFYKTFVQNDLTTEWIKAKTDAHRKWKPVGERAPEELTEEELANPN